MTHLGHERFDLRVELLSAAGTAWSPAAKTPMVPFLSASSLKGAVRSAAERILKHRKVEFCGRGKAECSEESPCLACALFGSRGRRGKLIFEDALMEDGGNRTESLWAPRRMRREVDSEASKIEELMTVPPSAFIGTVLSRSALTREEMNLLSASVATLGVIGSGTSLGLGFCRATLKPVPEEEEAVVSEPLSKELDTEAVGVILLSQGPLCVCRSITSKRHKESLDYIPAAHLRAAICDEVEGLVEAGVLGADHLNVSKSSSQQFSDCLAIGEASSAEFTAQTVSSWPAVLPLSSELSMQGGSASRSSGEEGSDRLLSEYVRHLLMRDGFPFVFESNSLTSVERQIRTASTPSLVNGSPVKLQRHYFSFCPIDSASGTAIAEESHSVSAVPRGTAFAGVVNRVRPIFKKVLCELNGAALRVGSLRSRGFGKVRLRLVAPPKKPDIATLMDDLNRAFLAEIGRWESLWPSASVSAADYGEHGRVLFSLTLKSDLMLPSWSVWTANSERALESLLSLIHI